MLIELRERIYRNEFNSVSLYDGLCNLAVFLKILNKNSGCYSNLYSTLHNLIYSQLEKIIPLIVNKEKVSFFDYDTICGLSGITNYLLNEEDKNVQLLKSIGNFFVSLGLECIQNEELHINWVSCSKNNSDNDYLDFSFSHGIAGPLLMLARLYKNNIIVPNQKKAISNILNEYEYISRKTETNIWSGKINKDVYFKDIIRVPKQREGWCYGSASVAMAFLEAAVTINNTPFYNKAYAQLRAVANMSIEEMHLTNEILCHGYSGMVALYRNLFDIYKDELFRRKALSLLNKTIDGYSSQSDFGFSSEDIGIYNEVETKRTCDKLDFLEGSVGIIMELSSWIKKKSSYEQMLMIK